METFLNEKQLVPKELSEIEIIYPETFPESYINSIAYWGNQTKQDLLKLSNFKDPQLLHLDIDYGNSCMLRCPHCFRRDNRFDKKPAQGFLSSKQINYYIDEAIDLGLKSIKILGRGEPFEDSTILNFFSKMQKRGVGVSVFTKGHVIGSDDLAKKIFLKDGITNGLELAKRIKELDVSILLGFNSFNKSIQEEFIGIDKTVLKNYVEFRNKALIRLCKAGLNRPDLNPTHLALIAAPIKPENINEIIYMYTWARRRNIYMLSCPTTYSGKGLDELKREVEYSNFIKRLQKLYTDIYLWNLKTKIISYEELKSHGVSLYPGCHVCNQIVAGLYLNLSGQITMCPGRVDEETIFADDIRNHNSLKEIWEKCENSKRYRNGESFNGKKYNFLCPPRKNYVLPSSFYSDVYDSIMNKLSIDA